MRLPNKKEIAFQRRAIALREKQEYFERRFQARDLLFRKGKGKMKNLKDRDKKFIRAVEHEGYRAYLMEFSGQVRPRYNVGQAWSRLTRRARSGRKVAVMSYKKWRRRWYGSQKVRYYRHDVPLTMQAKFKNLVMQNG